MVEGIKRPGGEMAKRPLNFFWVVDCSGSMTGEKIAKVNYAIQSTIPDINHSICCGLGLLLGDGIAIQVNRNSLLFRNHKALSQHDIAQQSNRIFRSCSIHSCNQLGGRVNIDRAVIYIGATSDLLVNHGEGAKGRSREAQSTGGRIIGAGNQLIVMIQLYATQPLLDVQTSSRSC